MINKCNFQLNYFFLPALTSFVVRVIFCVCACNACHMAMNSAPINGSPVIWATNQLGDVHESVSVSIYFILLFVCILLYRFTNIISTFTYWYWSLTCRNWPGCLEVLASPLHATQHTVRLIEHFYVHILYTGCMNPRSPWDMSYLLRCIASVYNEGHIQNEGA